MGTWRIYSLGPGGQTQRKVNKCKLFPPLLPLMSACGLICNKHEQSKKDLVHVPEVWF